MYNWLPQLGSSCQGRKKQNNTKEQNPQSFSFQRLCSTNYVGSPSFWRWITTSFLWCLFLDKILSKSGCDFQGSVFWKSFHKEGEGRGESDLAMMCFTSLNVFQGDTGTACGKVFLLVEKDAGVRKNTVGTLWKVAETDLDHPAARTATQTCTTSPYKDRMCMIWPTWE